MERTCVFCVTTNEESRENRCVRVVFVCGVLDGCHNVCERARGAGERTVRDERASDVRGQRRLTCVE